MIEASEAALPGVAGRKKNLAFSAHLSLKFLAIWQFVPQSLSQNIIVSSNKVRLFLTE
jgi:hypothetical protein